MSSREIVYIYSCSPLNSGYPVMPLNPFFPPGNVLCFFQQASEELCFRKFLSQGVFEVSLLSPVFSCVEAPCCKPVGDPQDASLLPLAQHHTSANLDSFREADLWRPYRQHTVVKSMISRLSEFKHMACLLLTAFVSSGNLLSLYVSQFPLLCCIMRI